MTAARPEPSPGLTSQATTKMPALRATPTSGADPNGTEGLTTNGRPRPVPEAEKRRATIAAAGAAESGTASQATTKLPAPSLPAEGPVPGPRWVSLVLT